MMILPMQKQAQTAIEYMLILTAVVAIALIGMRVYPSKVGNQVESYFNQAANELMGKAPPAFP
jgi:Flp pilus assembly pilin Flp